MFKLYRSAVLGVWITCLSLLMPVVVAANMTLTLVARPNLPEIELGAGIEELILIARVNLEGVEFDWTHQGPGELRIEPEQNRKVYYQVPHALATATAEVTVTVTVTAETGESLTETLRFTLLAGQTQQAEPAATTTTVPDVAPEPTVASNQPADPEVDALLKKANQYFRRTFLLEPEGKNAFVFCQQVLQRDPQNQEAREMLRKIALTYQEWGNLSYDKSEQEKAASYYQRALYVINEMSARFGEATLRTERQAIQARLQHLPSVDAVPGPTATPFPTATPTLTPVPQPTATPTLTATPRPTVTPSPTPTATPIPTATPRPTVTSSPTPTATPRSTVTPSPTPTVSLIERQLEAADDYFQKRQFLTPPGESAFELYTEVLRQQPGNRRAKEQLYAIAATYLEWAEAREDQQEYSTARTFYGRYLTVAEYLAGEFQDQALRQRISTVQTRLQDLAVTPTPTPTPRKVRPTPTPTPRKVRPTATPTPKIRFQITGVTVQDSKGKRLRPSNDRYTVPLDTPIRITIAFTNPRNHKISVVWTAGRGKVLPINNATNTYIATVKGGDYIVIKIWDTKTGEELTQTLNMNAR